MTRSQQQMYIDLRRIADAIETLVKIMQKEKKIDSKNSKA